MWSLSAVLLVACRAGSCPQEVSLCEARSAQPSASPKVATTPEAYTPLLPRRVGFQTEAETIAEARALERLWPDAAGWEEIRRCAPVGPLVVPVFAGQSEFFLVIACLGRERIAPTSAGMDAGTYYVSVRSEDALRAVEVLKKEPRLQDPWWGLKTDMEPFPNWGWLNGSAPVDTCVLSACDEVACRALAVLRCADISAAIATGLETRVFVRGADVARSLELLGADRTLEPFLRKRQPAAR